MIAEPDLFSAIALPVMQVVQAAPPLGLVVFFLGFLGLA